MEYPGFDPGALSLRTSRSSNWANTPYKTKFFHSLQSVGFEPTHPEILRPERSALDHSAKIAFKLW